MEEVTADSGYCSEKNLLYLKEENIDSYIRLEFMLYAIGRNINKYHRFLHQKIEKYEGKPEQKTA